MIQIQLLAVKPDNNASIILLHEDVFFTAVVRGILLI